MAGEAGKDIFQPGPSLDICRLAAAEQRVDDGGADGRIVVDGEQIDLAALCWQCGYVGVITYCIAP